NGSIRTVPVNHSAGPLPEGCEPARLISMDPPIVLRFSGSAHRSQASDLQVFAMPRDTGRLVLESAKQRCPAAGDHLDQGGRSRFLGFPRGDVVWLSLESGPSTAFAPATTPGPPAQRWLFSVLQTFRPDPPCPDLLCGSLH